MESAWKLGGLSIIELGKRVWVTISEILDRSAALSYYFIFALLPTLLFYFTCLSSVTGGESALGLGDSWRRVCRRRLGPHVRRASVLRRLFR
jgi:hypothetical protein